eukprot:gene15200-628_t
MSGELVRLQKVYNKHGTNREAFIAAYAGNDALSSYRSTSPPRERLDKYRAEVGLSPSYEGGSSHTNYEQYIDKVMDSAAQGLTSQVGTPQRNRLFQSPSVLIPQAAPVAFAQSNRLSSSPNAIIPAQHLPDSSPARTGSPSSYSNVLRRVQMGTAVQ